MKYLILSFLVATLSSPAFARIPFFRSGRVHLVKVDANDPTQVLMDGTLFYMERGRLYTQNRETGRIKKMSSSVIKIARFKNIVLGLTSYKTMHFWYLDADGQWSEGDLPASEKKLNLDDHWYHGYIQSGPRAAGVEQISDFLIGEDSVLALGSNGRIYSLVNPGDEVRLKSVGAWHVAGRYGVFVKSAVPIDASGEFLMLQPAGIDQIARMALFPGGGFTLIRQDQKTLFINDKAELCAAQLVEH